LLVLTPLGAPLGFVPFRVIARSLARDFARTPLTHFCGPAYNAVPPVPQSLSQLLLAPVTTTHRSAIGLC
jgi:hypothetical protein